MLLHSWSSLCDCSKRILILMSWKEFKIYIYFYRFSLLTNIFMNYSENYNICCEVWNATKSPLWTRLLFSKLLFASDQLSAKYSLPGLFNLCKQPLHARKDRLMSWTFWILNWIKTSCFKNILIFWQGFFTRIRKLRQGRT